MLEGHTDVKLAEEFATFFLKKIENICDKLTGIEKYKLSTNEQVPLLKKIFTTFLQWITQGNTQYEQQNLQTGPYSHWST